MTNPYRKGNGEFSSADEQGKMVALDNAARGGFDDFIAEKDNQRKAEAIKKGAPIPTLLEKASRPISPNSTLIPSGELTYSIPSEPTITGETTAQKTTGANFNPDFKPFQAKRRITKDIAEAQAGNHLPSHLGYAVTTNGKNLSVVISGVAEEEIYEKDEQGQLTKKRTPEVEELHNRVLNIVNSYNQSTYDYKNNRAISSKFATTVKVENDLDRKIKIQQEKEAAFKAAEKEYWAHPIVGRGTLEEKPTKQITIGTVTARGEKVVSRTPLQDASPKTQVVLENATGLRRTAVWGDYASIRVFSESE
jgi:hypothetical protein